MKRHELEELLARVQKVRVAVVGDACLDVYWKADMRKSELSRETPHFPLPVVEERFSLGGAANVAACVAALGAAAAPVALVGQDWRGDILARQYEKAGIETGGLVADESRVTPAYCKPLRGGISDVVYEDPRLDFENFALPGDETEERLLVALDEAAQSADVIAVADQLRFGMVTEKVRRRLARLGEEGHTIVVDSRDRVGLYTHVTVKPNEVEAARALGRQEEDLPVTTQNFAPVALALAQKTGRPAVVTLGALGALWAQGGKVTHAPAAPATPPFDIVGAGDAFLAGLCCALAAGADGGDALTLANLSAGVCVQKVGVTGTATPAEVLAKHAEGGPHGTFE